MNYKLIKKIAVVLVLLFTSTFSYAELGNDYFPLTEGMEWIYQDWWEIQDPEGDFEIQNKYIEEKVRVKKIDSIRILKVLSIEQKGLVKRVKMEENDYQGTRIYYAEYLLPLKVGSKWGDADQLNRKDNMYAYYIEGIEDVTVPAGTFEDCYKIVYRTCPDETIEWFCPGVGIVKVKYHHHGTIINYVSELK